MVQSSWIFGAKEFRIVTIFFLCLVFVSPLSGCKWPIMTRSSVLPSGFSPLELEKYENAVTTYKAGKYDESAEQFSIIREQTVNPAMARMALYGLACAKLMSANTPKAYSEALGLWRTWVQTAVPAKEHEDPILFQPIIDQKLIVSKVPLSAESDQAIEEGDYVTRWYIIRADKEIESLREQLAVANQKVENRDKKIKTFKNEIIRLNEQIKAFETIDQKIQNKKNAIPSSD